jgi:hypothetical protein
MIAGMSRIAVATTLLLAGLSGCTGCTKSAANQEAATNPGGGERPLGTGVEKLGGDGPGVKGGPAQANDARFRLAPEEGKLAIEVPTDAKANSEATAKIIVTAGSAYKVNTEFPTKLTLETTSGVTIAKAELKAGGHDKAKGDADVFDEQQLVFAVKLTPAASGSYTINGSFKFAVCDKAGSTCLAKKEPIAIQVAAK